MRADWPETTIGQILQEGGEIKTGPFGTVLKAHEYSDVGAPVISVGEVGYGHLEVHSDTPRVPPAVTERLPAFLLRRGDIVFGRKGAVDRVAFVRDHESGYFLGSDGIRLRLPPSCDPRFIAFSLRAPATRQWLLHHATGTTMASLNQEVISRIPLQLPPLPEQFAIAAVLGSLDDKIDLNRRLNATLEATARAIFKAWFVDFESLPAEAGRREPAAMVAERAARYGDPQGWRAGEIGDIADVVDCLHSKKPERQTTGRPLLQLSNIVDSGLLDTSDSYWITETDYRAWSAKFEARGGDCVITNVGRVGAVAQVPEGYHAALGRNMTGLRCRADFPFPTFLIECLRSDAMREEIERRTDTGTILNALNVRSIPRLALRIPPTRVAEQFEREVRPMRRRMELNLEESRTLAALRDTLLPKLLSGEVRVGPLGERAHA